MIWRWADLNQCTGGARHEESVIPYVICMAGMVDTWVPLSGGFILRECQKAVCLLDATWKKVKLKDRCFDDDDYSGVLSWCDDVNSVFIYLLLIFIWYFQAGWGCSRVSPRRPEFDIFKAPGVRSELGVSKTYIWPQETCFPAFIIQHTGFALYKLFITPAAMW